MTEQDAPEQDEQEHIVTRLIQEAVAFSETELSPIRTKATDYYLGRRFGNESEGRSQVVMTDVRDSVDAIVPGLMKVFFGPERVVEFQATSPQTVDQAAQATDYVTHVFAEENPGFLEMLAAVKDGLVRRLGIVKYGWEVPPPRIQLLEGVTESQLTQLMAELGPDAVRQARPTGETAPAAEPGAPPEPTYQVRVVVRHPGRPRVWAIPPEDFLFDRDARSLEDATIVAHRCEKTTAELRALGISKEDIRDHGGVYGQEPAEKVAREAAMGRTSSGSQRTYADKATERHTYVEAYVMLADEEGDEDEACLHLVRAIGPHFHVVGEPEPVAERPFAAWCPKPEPHTIDGQSVADVTMDLQLLSSSLFRGMLDSLALSLFPRTAYVEGQVSVADILNTEIGAPIRMYAPGMVTPFQTDFSGREVLPVLGYLDEVKERRTGQSKGAQGLDADALQSSTQSAVAAQVSATQQQLELYARIFAEQLLKPLFRGILRLVVAHQPRAQMMQLRGTWVDIDPSTWDAGMGVTVNVALGVGATQERIQTLIGIAAKQELIIQTLGPENPICGVPEYRNCLATIAELSGRRDVIRFFKEVPPGWTPPQAPPQMSPEQTLAQAQLQVETMRTQRELAIKEAELKLKQDAQQKQHEREEMKIALDAQLKRYQIELQFHGNITNQQMQADTRSTEALLDGHLQASKLAQQADQAAQQQQQAAQQQQQQAQAQAHQQGMAERQQQHSEYMDHRQQSHAEDVAAQQQSLAEDAQAHQQSMAEQPAQETE